jgi:hypothetical protein
VKILAQALSADGYAASASGSPVETAGQGQQLCQHHCPVAHVAAEFPQLCEAETEAFGRLLGTPVQRLATISRGDGICTTHVTAPHLVHTRAGSQARATVPDLVHTHGNSPSRRTPIHPATNAGGISA